jgi:hypothetical protein
MEDGLPKPSPELVIIGAGLIELDNALRELGLKKPGFSERVLERIRSDATRRAITRIRGPKVSPELLAAMMEAEAWAGQMSVVVQALRRA